MPWCHRAATSLQTWLVVYARECSRDAVPQRPLVQRFRPFLCDAVHAMHVMPNPTRDTYAYPQPPPPLTESSVRSPILGEAGFYCSAAAAYACPKATWSNKTNQQDASTCLACPSPGRMTTQSEGTSSIDGCVCQERYYKAAAGGCELCPVGATAPRSGSTLASVIISAGESAPILRTTCIGSDPFVAVTEAGS